MPDCEENSTNSSEIERHFWKHQIKVDRVYYCNICGNDWYVNKYGEERAKRKADQCCQSYIDDGSADAIARRNYFFTDGEIGYLRSVKGGREDK